MTADPAAVFEAERARLVALAYRVLGSRADAEDAVQDAWLRFAAASDVRDPAAWLTTVVTRRCLDVATSARARRERYVGPWLPEPVLGDEAVAPDVADAAVLAETLRMAFLAVLEQLSPLERAVFVLREVFAYDHAEVGRIVGRSPDAVRQLARRARAHLAAERPRFDADPDAADAVAERFLAACAGGDLPPLLAVLAPDVTLLSDGGGQVVAARRPLHGADEVARFLLGVTRRAAGASVRPERVNGGPGFVLREEGSVRAVVCLDVADGLVTAVRVVVSPRKLARLTARGL